MSQADALHRCLIELDIPGARAIWAKERPGMPQPENDYDALSTMHLARTLSDSFVLKLREYSHRWLLDHGLPSGLPFDLRPKAEQIQPKVVEGVGVASLFNRPYTPILRKVMEDSILECYADGDTEPETVKKIMMERRAKERKKLLISPER